jgi:hypothetical protein
VPSWARTNGRGPRPDARPAIGTNSPRSEPILIRSCSGFKRVEREVWRTSGDEERRAPALVASHPIDRVNGDRTMSNLPNWAIGSAVMALVLPGPIIAFFVVIAAEMLTDALTKEGVTAVCIVAAGAVGWSVFRSYRPQTDRSRLGSEEA